MKKLVRTTTVPLSLDIFCRGLLRELSQDYEVLAVSSPGPLLDKVADREGVRTVCIPMERGISPFKDIVSLLRMVRLFRKERPDAVHSMTPKAGLLSMMAGSMTGVPVRIHTFSGLVFPSRKGITRAVLKFTDCLTAACATHLIPEGEGVKRQLLSAGITKKPLKVLGHGNVRGIDLRHYCRTPEVMEASRQLRLNYGIPEGRFTFVFIGRIVREKGIEELVQAFTRLEEDAQLLLVGAIEPKDPISASTLEQINENPKISFTGDWVEDVRPFLAASDALVHPSWREGFPNTVIEAGAMELPCIVTDITGSNEIIIDGENGVIVPSRDAAALEKAMRSFISDRKRTVSMAGAARPLIESRYEQGFVRSCLKSYYEELLG